MNRSLIAGAISLSAMSTLVYAAKKPQLTPMEMQALQSKEFKSTKEQVFASVVSVFQDLGYQVTQAEMATGFISAESANKNKTNVLEAFGGMHSSGRTRATAFIEQFPSGLTKVRLNFLSTKNRSGLYGQSSSDDKPILDPQTYQVAFEKIDEALFERGALTKTATPAVSQVPKIEVPVTSGLSVTSPPAKRSASDANPR